MACRGGGMQEVGGAEHLGERLGVQGGEVEVVGAGRSRCRGGGVGGLRQDGWGRTGVEMEREGLVVGMNKDKCAVERMAGCSGGSELPTHQPTITLWACAVVRCDIDGV